MCCCSVGLQNKSADVQTTSKDLLHVTYPNIPASVTALQPPLYRH
jgi:hypothetical protein